MTRNIGDILRTLQLNIEGISGPNNYSLLKFANQHFVDIVLLQETYCQTRTGG